MQDDGYWFPAKRYGWGWGLPRRWQGWLVLGGYVASLAVGAVRIHPAQRPLAFAAWVSSLSLLLVAVCWRTGEPPRWRWGRED
jgi:hypothetical protein